MKSVSRPTVFQSAPALSSRVGMVKYARTIVGIVGARAGVHLGTHSAETDDRMPERAHQSDVDQAADLVRAGRPVGLVLGADRGVHQWRDTHLMREAALIGRAIDLIG